MNPSWIIVVMHMPRMAHVVCQSLPHRIRTRTYTGHPCGDDAFVRKVEAIVGLRLAPAKPDPKPRPQPDGEAMLWIEDEIRR